MKKIISFSLCFLVLSPMAFALECVHYQLKPNEQMAGGIMALEEMITTKKLTKENEGKFNFLYPLSPDGESKESYFSCPEKVYWKNGWHDFGGVFYLTTAHEDGIPLCEYYSLSMHNSNPERLACLKGEIDPSKYNKSVNNSSGNTKESAQGVLPSVKNESSSAVQQ